MEEKTSRKKLILITPELDSMIYENIKIRMIVGKYKKILSFNQYIRDLINEDWEKNKQKLINQEG